MNRSPCARTALLACSAAAMTIAAHPAHGDIIITGQQIGNDVVFTGGGSVDLSTWQYVSTVPQSPGLQANNALVIGPNPQTVDIYIAPLNFTGPAAIGPGTDIVFASTGSGDPFGFSWVFGLEGIFVPAGYNSGDPIVDSTATFTNHTLASLGLTEGEYTWTWDTTIGGTDFITVNIIPAPGALAAFGCAAFMRRRRRR